MADEKLNNITAELTGVRERLVRVETKVDDLPTKEWFREEMKPLIEMRDKVNDMPTKDWVHQELKPIGSQISSSRNLIISVITIVALAMSAIIAWVGVSASASGS